MDDTSGNDGDERRYKSGDYDYQRGDIIDDDGIRGYRSQETIKYSSINCGENH